jgi:hypothetical protein
VHQKHLVHRFYDGFAAERRLRQLLQSAGCAQNFGFCHEGAYRGQAA